jgi:ATP synthase protein I
MTGMKDAPDRPPFSKDGGAPSGAGMAGVGVEFLVLILIGMYAGQWVDRRFGSGPTGLIVGVFLGAIVSFYSLYRLVASGADKPVRK